MSDSELRELVASLAKRHAETEAAQKETAAAHKLTKQTVREVGRQIGYLGNKFGSFTEGLAFESVDKILRKRFHADNIMHRSKVFRGDHAEEYDVLGLRNGVHNE